MIFIVSIIGRISTYQSESEAHLAVQPAPGTRTDCAVLDCAGLAAVCLLTSPSLRLSTRRRVQGTRR